MKTSLILCVAVVVTVFLGFGAPKAIQFLPTDAEKAGTLIAVVSLGVMAICFVLLPFFCGKKKTS